MSDLLKTFREQGEPAPMFCAHMDIDGCELGDEECGPHTCHLGDEECEAVQEYVRIQDLLVDVAAFISCQCEKCAHLAPSAEVFLSRIGALLGNNPPVRFVAIMESVRNQPARRSGT